MPGTYEVTVRGGVEQLAKLGRDLKDAGASDLRREMLRAGQRTTKPVKAAIKAHALSDLPHGGGLNVWVASNLKISTQVRLTGNNVGVRFKTKHPGRRGLSDLPAINDGRVRHPLYGNRDHWYVTSVPAGFVGKAVNEVADAVRAEFFKAVEAVARKLEAG